MNLARLLTDTAVAHPHRVALRLDQHTVTYEELAASSACVAGLLAAQGIAPGDRVAIMLHNVPEFGSLYYGILRAGAVVVPMNPLLKAREVTYYLTDSGARTIFAWPTAAEEVAAALERTDGTTMTVVEPESFGALLADQERLDGVVDRDAEETAVILYTSGTTGQPKGAELTHGNLTRNVEVTQSDLLRLRLDDVVFGGLPLFHSFGQTCTLNASMAAGATLLLLPRFDPAAAAALLSTYRATVFAGVPTMYSALLGLQDAPEVPDLRVCVSGGAALPVEVLHAFEDRFGCDLLEGYGLSETSPVASFNRPGGDRKPGSIGYPVSGVELQVLDAAGSGPAAVGEVGEIAIRGHNVMKGYWQKPEATAAVLDEDGWFRTGDMGRVDEDGFYFIVDRKKDLIIRGGFNIYPREVEEVLYEHPDVAQAAVIAVPHPEYGEEVGAAVALRPGAQVTEEELRDYVKAQVAAYKYPRHVWFVDALPIGPTGKILKREIVAPSSVVPSGEVAVR
jgi:long-chain acyl-CoA synthetase